jgi:hypothetical protein
MLMAEFCADGRAEPANSWRASVTALRGRFTQMRYCF